MATKKNMGARISLVEGEDFSRIEITQGVEKWKTYALLIWLLCWLFCGIVFAFELTKRSEQGEQVFLGVLLGAWIFIFYRILRVTIWRFKGKELITFKPGQLTIKNAFGSMGKDQHFNMPHITSIKEVKGSKMAFFQFMENSFWVLGDNKFEFNYLKRTYQFGKQLDQNDMRTMKRLIEKLFRKYRKGN